MRATDQAAPVVPTFGTPKPAWMAGTGLVVALERLPQSAYVWDDTDPDVVWYGPPTPPSDCSDVLAEPFNNFTTNGWAIVGSPTIVAGRTGTAASITGSTANITYAISAPNQSANITVGCAFRTSNLALETYILQFLVTGSIENALILKSNGSLQFNRAGAILATSAATGIIAINTWYYVELQYLNANSGGFVIVRVNGVEVINSTGLDTRNTGIPNQLRFNAALSTTHLIDDLYLSTGPDCTFKGDHPITLTAPMVEPGEELVWDAPLTGIGFSDVWCDLEELTVTAGQPDVFDGFQTGHCRLVLRDPGDGRYTLRTPDGRLVYYAPGRRLAVYWLDEVGEPWWVFHGAIATWRQPGLDGRVEIDAYACPAWLAQTTGTTWTAGVDGQLPRPRLTAIAAAAGFVGPTAFDLGDVTLSVPEAADVFPLDVMRRSAASDAGILFADADDTLIYRDRRWRDGRTDQGDIPTFTDNVCALPPGAVVVWAPVAADVDLRLAGTVRLENAADPPLLATADGADYVDPRIVFSHAEADLWRTQPEGDAVAAHEAAVRSDARMALATFDVHLHDRRFDYWVQCVDRRLGDRIRWQHADNYTSDPPQTVLYDLDMVLTTLNHQVTPDAWTVTMGTAPAVGYTAVELWDVTGLTWDSADPLAVWR